MSRKSKISVSTKNLYGLHVKCEEAWAAKCRWEAMPRFAVLKEWRAVICIKCWKKVFDIQLTRTAEKIKPKTGTCFACGCKQNQACIDQDGPCGWAPEGGQVLCTRCRRIYQRVSLLLAKLDVRVLPW